MRRLLCLLLALMMLCGSAMAEASKVTVTWDADLEGAKAFWAASTGDEGARLDSMAKALVEHHTEVTETVIGNAVLEVLESPVLPAGPNAGMNRSSRVKKAAVLGVLLAAAVVAVISYFRDTVKNVEDVSTKLDLPLLSVWELPDEAAPGSGPSAPEC